MVAGPERGLEGIPREQTTPVKDDPKKSGVILAEILESVREQSRYIRRLEMRIRNQNAP
jgi:hypothetical protein